MSKQVTMDEIDSVIIPNKKSETIGFRLRTSKAQPTPVQSSEVSGEPNINNIQELVLGIAASYFQRRKDQGFPEYAEKDLLRMMDKVYTRYFDDILKDAWKSTPNPTSF